MRRTITGHCQKPIEFEEPNRFLKFGEHHLGVPVEQQSPRRIGRWIAVALIGALAAATVWFFRRDAPEPSAAVPAAVETATVVKTDLSATVSLAGTLGYGRAEPVKGGKGGIVTWLPQPGTTIKRGAQLYRVADRPVPLFYGSIPLYRDIEEPGMVGRDVRVVAANLEALGYVIGKQPTTGETVTRKKPAPTDAPATPTGKAVKVDGKAATVTERIIVRRGEDVLTGSLINAIKRWQEEADLPVTGRIGLGDVTVLPGAIRVDAVTALRGDDAETPLLTVTPTTKVITALADVQEAGTIQRGDPVTVVLPGDMSVAGKVTAVGAAVQEDDSQDSTAEPKRSVTVTVDDPRGLEGIDAATVQVELVGETRDDVLAVPVGALVALSEGGYAVQVADRGVLIAVTTGMFAKGLVEVTGDGLVEGMTMVTTS
ncbi:efflux RND transporter periplasmic adaptor subunit [Actinoplanes sp. GCM10030250]|uniref:efflux RND transporter periplasmic adaptor subunit n=1 Tax=Actinoplanes sp. GCM10030250 TaxID=3273376 RepID=UPI003610141A